MRELESELEFDQLLGHCAATSSFLVVDFFATWCPPCRRIAPYFEDLASTFSPQDVVFVKVDCDKCRDLATREQIRSLPTFKLYYNKACLNSVSGGPITRVEKMIEDYWLYESSKEIFSCERVPTFSYALAHLIRIAKSAKIAALNHQKYELPLSDEVFENYFLILPGFMQFLFDLGFEEQGVSLVLTDRPDIPKITRLISQISGPPPKKVSQDHPLLQRLAGYKKLVCHHLNPLSQKAAREAVPEAELLKKAAQQAGCALEALTPVDYLAQLLRWFKEDFFSWVNELECLTCSAKMSMSSGVPTPEEKIAGDAERVEVYTCTKNASHAQRRFPRYNNPRKLLETRQGRCGEWANCFALILTSLRRPSAKANGDSKEEVPWFPGVRFVVDFTDHVWCEVWLEETATAAEKTAASSPPATGHWVHVDVCEGLIDAPLVYEAGWHKQLSYIFAFTLPPHSTLSEAAIDTQDVIWRYTTDPAAVRSRRKEIGERRLAVYLAQQHSGAATAWAEASFTCAPFTLSAVMAELGELMQPSKLDPVAHPEVLRGRQSGALDWRKLRGETSGACDTTGAAASSGAAPAVASLWEGPSTPLRPTPFELEKGCIYLRYNCALDAYARPFAQPESETDQPPKEPSASEEPPRRASCGPAAYATINSRGWQSLASRWKNIARKHEKDWKMVYLARKENFPRPGEEGIVEWSVDLNGTDYSISEVTLFGTIIEIDESNKAALQLCTEGAGGAGGTCRRITRASPPLVACTDFAGVKKITLSAHLWTDEASTDAKSEAHLNWQKSQLFRQKDSDSQSWPLEWKLTLKKDENSQSA